MYETISNSTTRCGIDEFYNAITIDPEIHPILSNGVDQLHSRPAQNDEMQLLFMLNTDTFQATLSTSSYKKLQQAIAQGITLEEVGILLNLPK